MVDKKIIEELNNIDREDSLSYYDEYFSDMGLSETQKKQRVDFSMQIEKVVAMAVFYIASLQATDDYDLIGIITQIANDYQAELAKYMYVDSELVDYTQQFAESVTDTTLDHMTAVYFLSVERIRDISANEAETSMNYLDYKNALIQGKKYKTWKDVRDKRERKTHLSVGGTKIPIADFFYVGNSKMRYPHDMKAEAKEIINCRCQVVYTNE